jgi:ParB family transcriptional regulator, chromosome partitioning protein
MPSPTTELVPIDRIHENPHNPRYEAGDVTGLANSMGEDGQIQDLLVIPAPQFGDGHVMVEDGLCRLVAARARKETALWCKIRYPEPDDDLPLRAILTGLITDEHKKPLHAIERAKAYGRLRDEYGMSAEEIGKRLGLNGGTIGRYLSLLELAPKAQDAVRDGKLPVEKAVQAVQNHRARARRAKGQAPVNVGWEPDHFSKNHILARRAAIMCEAREHSGRRRLGGACGDCWERAIRADERKVMTAELGQAGLELPAAMLATPITADGGIRANGVRGAK